MKFKRMISWIIRTFNLHGSWVWACKQMDKGEIIYRTTDTGTAKYKLDNEGQRRIVWCYVKRLSEQSTWKSANVFLDDMECTSWDVWVPQYVVRKVRKDIKDALLSEVQAVYVSNDNNPAPPVEK